MPVALRTCTLWAPVPGAVIATQVVAEVQVNLVTAIPPTVIAEVPVKDCPVIVIRVPPAAGPLRGVTAVMLGRVGTTPVPVTGMITGPKLLDSVIAALVAP